MSYNPAPKTTPTRLAQYRTLEDVWQDNLRNWLKRASSLASEQPCFLILPHLSQSQWIRIRAAQENISISDITFLDLALLRSELCHHQHLPYFSIEPSVFEFSLQMIASQQSSAIAQSVALQPASCLQAIKDLTRAHWSLDSIPDSPLPPFSKNWKEKTQKTNQWHPDIEQTLSQTTKKIPKNWITCLIGWDAEFLPHLSLLQTTFLLSQDMEIYVPMPRITGRDPDVLWIQTLEYHLQVNCETCRDSGYESANFSLVSNLFLNQKNHAPSLKLFSAKDESQPTQVVLQQLTCQISHNSTDLPIGIIAPQDSPATIELIHHLQQKAIPFHHEFELRSSPSLTDQFFLAYWDYIKNQCHIEKFIILIEILNELSLPNSAFIDPIETRKRFYYLFHRLPTTQTFTLAKLLNPQNSLDKTLLHLIEKLPPWPQTLTWLEAQDRWKQVADLFSLPFSWEKYFPENISSLFDPNPAPKEIILNFIKKLISQNNLQKPDFKTLSPLILTTLSQATHRQWSHLIFLECNESVWPSAPTYHAFLEDELRKKLNQLRAPHQTYLLTSEDYTVLENRRFLDLCENCQNSITLITREMDSSNPSTPCFPNKWFRQCLNLFPDSLQSVDCLPLKPLTSATPLIFDKNEFIAIHQSRQNPEKPFDEYNFNLSALSNFTKNWNGRTIHQALLFPATFALKTFLEAESNAHYQFHFNLNKTTGIWTWDWIKTVFQTLATKKPWTKETFFHELDQTQKHWSKELTHYLEIDPLPLWWSTLIEKSFWMASQCLNYLWETLPNYTDYQVTPTFRINSPISLDVHCDLLFIQEDNDKNHSWHVIHFYPNYFKGINSLHLEQNQGLQLAAYLAIPSSIKNITVSCLSPYQGLIKIFTGKDWEAALPYFKKLATLQKQNCFGMKGPLYHSNQKTETLPLATRPISEKILAAKQALTN
ncbi:MAG: hypothetical protein K1X66_06975 [Verrucomicrobiae bacterium]|nr:hypothetical protein [Verrucomicrobiae bacterium]